ncbi:dihydroxyacetone kinase subunit DhaL [Pectinatus haikarae]|uniref:Dihydroxyacetone kinase-like protein n=1 Tax=Pectinatus haikarae TaxID=349096 RepID=A0ABT9Y3G9_9FIRM|nr:dihydroxyacetone kinase subunit DhaL [Pectinatus haikarae]MDQ0202375.1 dihydroxyacetone kinase-like protein [Pectinatus haikarae]
MTGKNAVKIVGQAVIEKKMFLTDLDQAIGDGDHGINMARGFESVLQKTEVLPDDTDISSILKTVGMGLISSVGGASGPLYGTAFLRAAGPCKDKTNIDANTAKAMLDAAIKGIQDRGKAQKGEKTMLDALIPASEAFAEGIKADKTLLECLSSAVQAAQDGVEYTKTIIATKGRASYLAERSIGHQDPGATSATIMLTALYNYIK